MVQKNKEAGKIKADNAKEITQKKTIDVVSAFSEHPPAINSEEFDFASADDIEVLAKDVKKLLHNSSDEITLITALKQEIKDLVAAPKSHPDSFKDKADINNFQIRVAILEKAVSSLEKITERHNERISLENTAQIAANASVANNKTTSRFQFIGILVTSLIAVIVSIINLIFSSGNH